MLIVDKLNCAVMPICKAGSSSLITSIAEEAYDEECIASLKAEHKHSYSRVLRKKASTDFQKCPCDPKVREKIKNYFKFAFVRNPWHRIVSACLQFRRWIDISVVKDDFKGLHLLKLYDLMNRDYSFENFVHFVKNVERNHTEYANQHWRSQVGFLQIEALPNCKTEYDFIGKLESAQEDYSYVADKLKFKNKALPNLHHPEEYNYKDFYTNTQLIDDVGDYYSRDIDVFKYEFDK